MNLAIHGITNGDTKLGGINNWISGEEKHYFMRNELP